MKNDYRDDGLIWFDDQICEIADLLLGVQGLKFVYLKRRDRKWLYKLGNDGMKFAFLNMSETQIRIIEILMFEGKTVTDARRELNLTVTEIRMEIREMRKALLAVM